jgi:cAMP-dependent protein kinase regulator
MVLLLAAAGLALAGVVSVVLSSLGSLAPPPQAGHRTFRLRRDDHQATAALLAEVPLFSHVAPELLRELAARARWIGFRPGAVLIRQGDAGEEFFVLAEGLAEVRVEAPSGLQQVVALLRPRDGFGEVALIDSVPRTAGVRAVTRGVALAISRDDFFAATAGKSAGDIVALIRGAHALRATSVFADIRAEALARFIGAASVINAPKGQLVIRRGEPADRFYVAMSGGLEVLGPDDATVLASLGKGDPFGEVALLSDAPRTASVRAATEVSLLAWGREAFYDFFIHHIDAGARLEFLGAARLGQN